MTQRFAGWGFRAGAQAASFADCWGQACAQLAPGAWTFALLASRRDTPAWSAFEAWAHAAVPQAVIEAWHERDIAQIATPSVSPRLVERFATGSVSEALALHAAGQQGAPGTLVLRRLVSADRQATLAVAQQGLPFRILETGVAS